MPGLTDVPQRSVDAKSYDQLVLAVVQEQDAGTLSDRLNEARIPHSRLESAGGFLQIANSIFIIGLDSARYAELRDLVSTTCFTRTEFVTVPWTADVDYVQPVEVEVGGASVFGLQLERVERI